MDEAFIDDEFKCLICNEPFEKPRCTPCDHTFCQSCIEQWIKKSSDGNGPCPICRRPLSIEQDLKPANRLIASRIDRYLVQCLACRADGIPRGSFSDHMSKMCKKMDVPCSASNLLCPWTGARDLLENHLKSCPYQQIRPVLEAIHAKNSSLEQMLIDINGKCQAQQSQIDDLIEMVKSLQSK